MIKDLRIGLMTRLVSLLPVIVAAAPCSATVNLDLEVGMVQTGYNYFQRPNNSTGTRVDLETGDAQPYARFQAFYRINSKHSLRLLLAPLVADYRQTASVPTRYGDVTFPSGAELDIRYQFNSYRLGYIYTLSGNDEHRIDIGFTGKIRDAMIRVKSGDLSEEFDNVGFVPLLYIAAESDISHSLSLGMQADGAAAPQGGAIDLSLYLGINTEADLSFKVGGRFLEGGADNDSLEGFAQFWYGFGALNWRV